MTSHFLGVLAKIEIAVILKWPINTHTHTHTRLTALCPGHPGGAGTRKVKPI